MASESENKPTAVSLELSAESRKARFLRNLEDYKRHLDQAHIATLQLLQTAHDQGELVQNPDQMSLQFKRCECLVCKNFRLYRWLKRQLLKGVKLFASLLGHKSHQRFDLLQHTFNRDILTGHGTSSARVGGELNGTSLAGEEVS